MKKNINKNSGVTLIELLFLVIAISAFILLIIQMDMKVDEQQNTRKVGTQINQILAAIDKRISIEGKDYSSWKNGTEWNNGVQFRNFLRQELIGSLNSTCGVPSTGWTPTQNLNGLTTDTDEGKQIVSLHEEALHTKLVPCSLWGVYPYNLEPKMKITGNANGKLTEFLMSFNFKTDADFTKNFNNFNASFNFAREQKNITLLTNKSFSYRNSSGSEIELSQCLALKKDCMFTVSLKLGSESNDDTKFKVDSSNSFEDNLKFSKDIGNNNSYTCKIWSEKSGVWSSNNISCGVTGGTKGYSEVSIVGDNLEGEKVTLSGECSKIKSDYTTTNSTCGITKDNNIVELITSKINSNKIVSDSINVKESNSNLLSIKNDGSANELNTNGVNQTNRVIVTPYKRDPSDPLNSFDLKGLNTVYRDIMSGKSFITKSLNANSLSIGEQLVLNTSITSNTVDLTDSFKADGKIYAQTLTLNNSISTPTTAPEIFTKDYKNNSLTTSNTIVNKEIQVNDKTIINTVNSSDKSIIAGALKANDLLINNMGDASKSTSFKTEQLNFRSSFINPNEISFAKSAGFDGVGTNYIVATQGEQKGNLGWGAEGYLSKSGIAAKRWQIDGNLIIDSQSANLPNIYSQYNYIYNHSSYRDGLVLNNNYPDTRANFNANEYGRLFLAPYYNTGGPEAGFNVGAGGDPSNLTNIQSNPYFFFGINTNDKTKTPVITNLASDIYGYSAQQDINPLISGQKMILNNLNITANSTYFFDGAYFRNGSMPKNLDGSLKTIRYGTYAPDFYWETADPIRLGWLYSNIDYYLNKISYMYNLFVDINKQGTIKGIKGNRGQRGRNGVDGINGINGSDGIPGLVGLRGGETK